MAQKALLIWDAFRVQQLQLITDALDDYNIVTVMVLKNLTHLRLSTLKSIHAKLMGQIYQHFKAEGRQTIINGWKAAGVIKAVEDARNGHIDELNLFV